MIDGFINKKNTPNPKKYSFDSGGIFIGTETIFRCSKTLPKCS
jgi:hypothetical protein